jgi:hypothetical protein
MTKENWGPWRIAAKAVLGIIDPRTGQRPRHGQGLLSADVQCRPHRKINRLHIRETEGKKPKVCEGRHLTPGYQRPCTGPVRQVAKRPWRPPAAGGRGPGQPPLPSRA